MADPWYFSELGIGALHARGRGEGIRVAVLDSGVENPNGTFGSLLSLTPGGSHAANHDNVGHGTVCASLIASQNPDAPGVAPRVDVTSIPVVIGGGTIEGLVRDAFQTAIAERCHVISCSFTLPTIEQATQDGMREAANRGVVIVAASGNDPNVFAAFPERTPNVLVVGPHGHNRELLPSRFGLFTDVLAPGIDLPVVTSAGPVDTFGETSGATAVVAGIVALVLCATRTLGTARVGLAIEGLVKSTAWEKPNDPSNDQALGKSKGSGFIGGFAPVGLQASIPVSRKVYVEGMLSVIDLGALTTQRFKAEVSDNKDTTTTTNVTFGQVFSPGAYVMFGLGGSPLVIGGGVSWAPSLRKVSAPEMGGTVSEELSTLRVGGFLAMDVTILPL